MMKIKSFILLVVFWLYILFTTKVIAQTSILKWQDGKDGCVTLTFDDGSINQFRIAIPLLNEREFHATFFIITGGIPGSKYQPTFIGRPIQDIINESKTVPTNKNNLFERCSAIYYLAQTGNYNEIKNFSDMSAAVGEQYENGNYQEVYSIIDDAFYRLRESGHNCKIKNIKNEPGESYQISWNILRKAYKEGHEIADHTVSHPYMPVMDKANILYEIEKCSKDIEDHLSIKRVLSVECPYGIDDKRVLSYVYPEFPFVRNDLQDKFIKEILRGEPGEPISKDEEYVQWQRGPVTNTPTDKMEEWIDTTIKDDAWLVLVFHGVEGIGWEAIPKEKYEKYFDYIKAKEKHLWVATFQDAYKYIRERMNTKVKSESRSGKVTVNLSNTLNQDVYDLPITLKTIVPESWQSVRIQQGENRSDVKVQKESSKAFIQYRSIPNSSKIIITKNN